jgi:hypothetical protein
LPSLLPFALLVRFVRLLFIIQLYDSSSRRRVAAPHVDNLDSQTLLSFELFYGGMCAQEVSHA